MKKLVILFLSALYLMSFKVAPKLIGGISIAKILTTEVKAQNPLYLNSAINTSVPSWDVSFLYNPTWYVLRIEDSTNLRIRESNIYLEKQPAQSVGTPSNVLWVNPSNGLLKVSAVSSLSTAIGMKRQESYSGSTNASGNYTVTFATPYAVAPNIQVSITNQAATNQFVKVTSVSTTGFTINVFQRNSVTLLTIDVLLSATVNVNGATVDVLITEK